MSLGDQISFWTKIPWSTDILNILFLVLIVDLDVPTVGLQIDRLDFSKTFVLS